MSLATLLLLLAPLGGIRAAPADEYEIGGPLAGLKLPLFPTQHGEPPGHPGCLPGRFATEELQPEVELYPGAVEHYRNYWFKYCPVRSFFDRQSQLRNWTAPAIPGVQPAQSEPYAAPVYWVPRHTEVVNTGAKLAPVTVVRCKVGSPVLALDLGELERGLYAVRVIAAVETAQLRSFRLPAYLAMAVNDGLKGEESRYRIRIGYCDEFYSVAEIYFHAPEKRRYQARLWLDQGSRVDLLVHSVTLDSALAGTLRQAIKTRTTIHAVTPPGFVGKTLTRGERLTRDAAIWEAFPPDNAQGNGTTATGGDEHVFSANVAVGAQGKSAPEIADAHGAWTSGGREAFLVNHKLGLKYSFSDLRQHRPLPDPYPLKDDGAGLFEPDPADPGKGQVWAPIASEVQARYRDYPGSVIHKNVDAWTRTGNPDAAREAAVALVRFAYAFPTLDYANFLVSVTRDPGPYGREWRCRRREATAGFYPHYQEYVNPILYDYDRLFATIQDNQELADSVGRFVPWVKSPRDVIELIDVYLVQTTAKRILRYHYVTDPMDIANLASVVGDRAITDPWMDWLFARTFIYPLPPVGIQDGMITGTCRDGCEFIGSTYYAQGEGAMRVAAAFDQYLKAGGNPRYDLSDPARFPKPVAQCYWRLRNIVAGADFLRIGDVTGPDKAPGHTLADLGFARAGWEWTHDPRFAFVLKHQAGRGSETDAEWAQIEQAAAGVSRAPWLENRSRVLPMWAGVLETGLQHDDYRFRRAAYVRVGFGVGHEHADTLDLQVVAHGQPATIDGGQRGGYSTPGDRNSRVHNLVEVDGQSYQGYSWVRTLGDSTGARFLAVQAEPPPKTTLFARQVALIDVDEGKGSQPLPIAQQRPLAPLPEGITPANSYVFDVFRVAGGKTHTHCFHGTVNDDFQWNVQDASPVTEGEESETARYLRLFKDLPARKFAGSAPAVLRATWRQTRGSEFGNERQMLGPNFRETLPRRHTRLHLFDVAGARAMRAEADCYQWKYHFTDLMVQQTTAGAALDSAFVALVEPYVGEPIITSTRRLPVTENASDARRAVAVEVKTANGHTDICFADGQPERVRRIPAGGLRAAGEFAFYATDGLGLRQATLTGGTLLEGPEVRLGAKQRVRTGKVTRVDYAGKRLWIDQAWSAGAVGRGSGGRVFEIGVPGHWTTYEAVSLAAEGGGTRIGVWGGADLFRSGIRKVDAGAQTVECTLGLTMGNRPGLNRGLVASNEAMTTFWRADLAGDKTFKLTGPPVSPEAFGPAGVMRLWEYGVGDHVRQSTSASLRRTSANVFALEADVDVTLGLKAKSVQLSHDGGNWTPQAGRRDGAWLTIRVPVAQALSAPVFLRVTP
jgi:hypothetical protein